jgi:hypothetical protein
VQCVRTHGASPRSTSNVNSSTERNVSLSTTEAEIYAGVTCVQDMLYTKNVLELLGFKVKLLMVLEMDNQGAEF